MQNSDSTISQKYYRCKLTDYGDNNGEVTFWYDEPLGRAERREACLYPAPRKSKLDVELSDDSFYSDDAECNEERALRRAKSKARKLVMTLKSDRLLTLTFKENLTDRIKADKYFVRFIKLIHTKYPKFKYVCVAELQKRGAWHYHLAVSGFQDVGFLRATWNSLVQGAINVTSPRNGGDKNLNSASVAGYITKYMVKAFKELYEFGKYRYRASNNIKLRQATVWINSQNWHQAQKDACDYVESLYGHVGSFFFSADWSNGWAASWSLSLRSNTSNANVTTS